jgi:multiple sugar transport system ATP-binding protein
MPIVEVKNLTKIFGSVVAVKDVSFSIEERDFLILLGPSGCGKTTILRMIAGLEIPTSGEIILRDRLVFSSKRGVFVPAREREVGLVFQSYALWPHMTVFENVGFGLQVKKMKSLEIKRKVEQVLEFLRLEDMAGRYPQEMSGGQQQRVALARMLVCEPGIFLMDEPLSNLDAKLRLEMRAEIKNLHYQTGATTIYVTHDQVEGLTMANKISVLNRGEIEQMGEPKHIYKMPSTLFVADFIGSPTINKIRGVVGNPSGAAGEKPGNVEIVCNHFSLSTAYEALPEGKEVVLAIRPENISRVSAPGTNTLSAEVHTILPAGPETILQVTVHDMTLNILMTQETEVQVGDQIYIHFPPEHVLIFDEAEQKLLPAK